MAKFVCPVDGSVTPDHVGVPVVCPICGSGVHEDVRIRDVVVGGSQAASARPTEGRANVSRAPRFTTEGDAPSVAVVTPLDPVADPTAQGSQHLD